MKFKKGIMKSLSILAILCISLPALQFFLPTASAAGEYDDAYEENDTIGEAWEFSYNTGYISGINQSDDDWFYYEVNPHDKITVNIYYNAAEANMNVSLYNSSETLLATEIEYGYGQKKVEYINTHDQNELIYLKVFGNNSMKLYDLNAYFDYVSDLEPNNVMEDASKLHFPGFFSDGIQEDDDWYDICVEANQSLHVSLRDWSYSNAINITLFDNTHSIIAYPYESSSENNKLQWFNPNNFDMSVYLLVNGTNESYGYELDLDMIIDREPNNSPSEAVELPFPGTYDQGMFQEGQDYYKLFLKNGDFVKFHMSNLNYGSYYMNMTLLNSSLMPVSVGFDEYNDGNIYLNHTNFGEGQWYYLLIDGDNMGGSYSFDFGFFIDLEPNNDFGSASTIYNPGFYSKNSLDDEDWYKFYVKSGEEMEFRLDDMGSSEPMLFHVFNSSSNFLMSSWDQDGLQYVSFKNNNTDQFFYFRVYSNDGNYMAYGYNLDLQILDSNNDDDPYEPNNFCSEAPSFTLPLSLNDLIQKDDDYFKFYLNAGDAITVALATEPGNFINILLRHWDGYDINDQNNTGSYGGYCTLNFVASESRDYYASISGSNTGDIYNLSVIQTGTDDWAEENDDYYQAEYIGESGNLLEMQQWDDDYYSIEVMPNNRLMVNFTSDPTDWYDMQLYDIGNIYLWSAGSQESGKLWLNWTNTGTEDVNITIRIYGNNNGKLYWVSYGQELVTGGTDDWAEENDDYYHARHIGGSGYLSEMQQWDDDYYSIEVMPNNRLMVNFTSDPTDWYDMQLYDIGNIYLWSASSEESGKLWLNWTNTGTENVNITILITGNGNGKLYWVSYGQELVTSETDDDEFEPNDNREQAAWISGGYYPDLYQGNDDWYNISVAAGYVLEVELWFNGSSNDIDFELYNSLGGPIGGSYSVTDYESFIFHNLQESQTLSLRVYGNNNFQPYTMNVNIYPDSDDWMEENDYSTQACFLGLPFEGKNLRNFDDDWYEFHLEPNDIAEIHFDPKDASNPLQVEIWEQNGDLVFNVTVWGLHTISVEAYTNPNDYTMRVSGSNYGGIYDMEILLNGVSVNTDDWMEDNDESSTATSLNLPFEEWGLRSMDEDWYSFWMEGGDFIDVFVWNSNPTDYLRLVIYDPSWNVIKNQTIYGDSNGPIYINPAESGFYFILITTDFTEFHGNHYDLRVDLNDQRFVHDDWAEENDVQTSPYSLANNDYYSDLVCLDDDWFVFGPIMSQETLHVELRYDTVSNLVIELFDGTGAYHGFQVDDQTWGKVLTWTAGGYFSNAYLLVSGDYNTPYTLDLRVGTAVNDDWAEENDDISSAKDLSINRHNGLIQNDMDWYKIWLEPNDLLDIILEYDNALPGLWMDLDLYEWSSTAESLLVSGTNDNGKNKLSYTNENLAKYVYIRVNGPNNGDWYDLDLTLNPSTSPEEPSLDWVAYNSGDFAEWDATVEVFTEGGNSTLFEGSLRGDITDVQLGEHSVIVSSNMQWSNIPTEYLQGWITGAYNFDIEGDGFAYPAYFGFASVFVGDGFHYSDTQKIFTNIFDTSYDILDDGRTLEVEYNPSEGPYYKMRVTYTEDGFLKEISIEGDFVDAVGNIFAYGKIHLLLSSSSVVEEIKTDDTMTNSTDDGNGTGADSNPFSGFDLSSIPGFPAEIIGGVLGLTIIAMIVAVKKKSKKVF
ncbi:hypothetical protein [Candidatus Lokiarchaeum ossiferum]|uniref:hypothetical protein n=1 Tax=Candidatus Lokiarchaeum ossiferum TaxID=2951803 RepID=UPI00352ED7FA